MKPGAPSATAISVASLRAAHLHLFDGPKIHEDTFALRLTGIAGADELRAGLERRGLPDLRRVSAYFALRHRFSEDRLHAALGRGVTQVVLLGAGLDSFALRHPRAAEKVRFVEVDHPDSQRWKLDRLRALGLETPGVAYLPIDFAKQDLARELALAGVRTGEPTFFAWLGVTQYIAEAASLATLAYVARHEHGSEVVFDVILPFDGLAADELAISSAARASSAQRGEPWLTFFEPTALAPRLLSMGFGQAFTLTPAEATVYYRGQPASVRPLAAWQLMSAIV